MLSLVRANIFQRKTRAAITMAAVAIEVAAVLIIVGLTHGTLSEVSSRIQGVGADIMVQPAGNSPILGLSGITMRERYGEVIRDQVSGVAAVAPMLLLTETGIGGGAPVNIWGIDERFANVGASIEILEGRNLEDGTDLVVDRRFAQANDLAVGQTVSMLGDRWQIVGIARAGVGARMYVSLRTLQEKISQEERVHAFFVKAEQLDQVGEVASRIEAQIPGVETIVMEEYAQALNDGFQGLNHFNTAISGIAVVLSFLVILLAMYTSIIERTREIGILKALGSSKVYIVLNIMQEAMLLCAIGVVVGYVLARLTGSFLTTTYPTLTVEFSWDWSLYAIILGLVGGIFGSLYPALRAARQDPVYALRDE